MRNSRKGHNNLIPFFVITVLFLSQVSCERTSPTTAAAPVLSPQPRSSNEIAVLQTNIASESFEAGVEGWQGWAEGEASSNVTWDGSGQLLWSVHPASDKAAALAYGWQTLAEADGLKIRLSSNDRAAFIILGVQEADESTYGLVLPLSVQQTVEHSIPYESLSLLDGSEDENGRLDRDQLTTFLLLDIAGFIAAPTPNQIAIDEIALWEGSAAPFDLSCSASTADPQDTLFRTGVDANYVPQGETTDRGYWVDEQRVDALELFAANGVDAFRLRLWVKDQGESGLDYAIDLAQRVQKAGLRPYLVIFLSEEWADVNKQPAPKDWADRSIEERAQLIREYTRDVALQFIEAGIDLDFYEIGNEIDYGISGVFAGATQPRDAATLRETIWPDEATLIQAAIAGVQEADPEAQFMLHIATTWDPEFTVAFFQTMIDLDITYDYVGLSIYPSAFGLAACERFCETLERLTVEVGKPIVIAETAYPAHPPMGGPFGDWGRVLPGYSITPEGQAHWLADFLNGMRDRSDVVGVYVFSPDFWFSGEVWSAFALFDDQGRARPAVASFGDNR